MCMLAFRTSTLDVPTQSVFALGGAKAGQDAMAICSWREGSQGRVLVPALAMCASHQGSGFSLYYSCYNYTYKIMYISTKYLPFIFTVFYAIVSQLLSQPCDAAADATANRPLPFPVTSGP